MTERKRATARGALLEAPRVAHAFCPCQQVVPEDQARPVCDTGPGRGTVAPDGSDRCVVCAQLVADGIRWCGHG